jgi:hypothetical protein
VGWTFERDVVLSAQGSGTRTPRREQLRCQMTTADYLWTDDRTITVLDERGGSFKSRLWT